MTLADFEVVDTTVTVHGVAVRVRGVLCTHWQRARLDNRSVQALRNFVAETGLHRDGDGDMFVMFIEKHGPLLGEAFATVVESNTYGTSRTLAWSDEDEQAALREAFRQINAVRGLGSG